MRVKAILLESCAVKERYPVPDLKNLQNSVTKKLTELNIYTTSVRISLNAGKFPDIEIEGVLNTDLWPK